MPRKSTRTRKSTTEPAQRDAARHGEPPAPDRRNAARKDEGEARDETFARELADRRARQVPVSRILSRIYGPLANCDPGLWESRAFLLLVGIIYQKLVDQEDRITTEELWNLSRMLAEQSRARHPSRAGAASRGSKEPRGNARNAKAASRSELSRMLSEVYGTVLPDAAPAAGTPG